MINKDILGAKKTNFILTEDLFFSGMIINTVSIGPATIESIESSTKIEGSKLSNQQVEALLSNLEIQEFTTRDE